MGQGSILKCVACESEAPRNPLPLMVAIPRVLTHGEATKKEAQYPVCAYTRSATSATCISYMLLALSVSVNQHWLVSVNQSEIWTRKAELDINMCVSNSGEATQIAVLPVGLHISLAKPRCNMCSVPNLWRHILRSFGFSQDWQLFSVGLAWKSR